MGAWRGDTLVVRDGRCSVVRHYDGVFFPFEIVPVDAFWVHLFIRGRPVLYLFQIVVSLTLSVLLSFVSARLL